MPEGADLARRAWNLMGGLDWAALPVVVELLGVADPERLVYQLAAIRDHHQQAQE